MSQGLKGRTAVITGAGGGLGSEQAWHFAEYGAEIIVDGGLNA